MTIDPYNYFHNIKTELSDESIQKGRKAYYRNAIKDLTQTQRAHLIAILQGDSDSRSDAAKDIVTALENYKTAYNAAPDKKAYITARNPAREKSLFKSIARALCNWGSRISSEKVLKTLIKTEFDNPIMSEWLSQFKNDYLAHAMGTNTAKILDGGILKPAEMLLREGIDVEYEKGASNGDRGTTRLPKLTPEDLQSLQDVLFSNADQARLNEILNDPQFESGKTKYKALSKTRKELNEWDSIPRSELKEMDKLSKDEELKLYLEYTTLSRKQNGLRAFFILKNKTSGIRWVKLDSKTNMQTMDILNQLSTKYNCTSGEILTAFDQSRPQETRIDTYLRQKFNDKKYSQDELAEIRSYVLRTKKLNQEIRMSMDKIFWSYGNAVVLLGGDKSHVRVRSGNEAILHTPIANKDFYTIDLKNTKNLLILGPKRELESYKIEYGDRIVYIEDLSSTQKEELGVPDELR